MGPNFLDCWSEQINNKSHKKLFKKNEINTIEQRNAQPYKSLIPPSH